MAAFSGGSEEPPDFPGDDFNLNNSVNDSNINQTVITPATGGKKILNCTSDQLAKFFSHARSQKPLNNKSSDSALNGNEMESISIVNKYDNISLGPYEVIVMGNKEKNIGNLHPMALAKILYNMKLSNLNGPFKKGRNKIIVKFENPKDANNLLDNPLLAANDLVAYIPDQNISCKGIVRGVDKELEVDEILKNMNSPTMEIMRVKRFNRRVSKENNEQEYIKTGTCLVTFKGKVIPSYVSVYGLQLRVEPYIQPVTQCYNCLLYGHTKKQCRGKTKCQRCGKPQHENLCQEIKCTNCDSSSHSSIDKECLEYIRQQQIKCYMALDGMSFQEPDSLLPRIKKIIISSTNLIEKWETFQN